MPKDNSARACRHPADRVPQLLAHPFVGHQPVAGPWGLVRCHGAFYSARHVRHSNPPCRYSRSSHPLGQVGAAQGGRCQPGGGDQAAGRCGHSTADRCRRYGFRRKPRKRGGGEMASASRPASGPQAAHDRPASIEQGRPGNRVVRRRFIRSIDRSLLHALIAAGEKVGRFPDIFVQVNIGAEEQKGGVAIAELPVLLGEVRASPLPLAGLMAMPPVGQQPGPYFALLAELARRHGVNGLSMGMSSDYPDRGHARRDARPRRLGPFRRLVEVAAALFLGG